MEMNGMTVIERDTMEAIKSTSQTLQDIKDALDTQNILLKSIADALQQGRG